MVIRGYLSGHAAREYKAGKRLICGVSMPEGMKENDKFPEPIITPATKAEKGDHDEDISREEILKRGIVSEEDYVILEDYTKKLFQRGTEIAADQGAVALADQGDPERSPTLGALDSADKLIQLAEAAQDVAPPVVGESEESVFESRVARITALEASRLEMIE